MVKSHQIRAARALLSMTVQQLADAAGVSYASVQRAEQGYGAPRLSAKKLDIIEKALERAGIGFLEDGQPCRGDGVSVEGRESANER